jgi:hypothetical protein
VNAPAKKLRVGLTDPEGPLARHLRDAFHSADLLVSRFVPIGSVKEAGRLSEIDGEPEIFFPPVRETIGDLDLLVLAGSDVDEEARRLAEENEVSVFDAVATPPAALGCAALIEASSPQLAGFTLLLPAAEAGTAGIQELFEQSGDALNFRQTRAPVFGNRLAFNLFRDAKTVAMDRRIEAYMAERCPSCTTSVIAVRGAIFHGHAGSAFLRFADVEAAEAGAARLRKNPAFVTGGAPGSASPAEAVERSEMRIDPPTVAGDILSVWFAFDGLALAARAVLDRARRLVGG